MFEFDKYSFCSNLTNTVFVRMIWKTLSATKCLCERNLNYDNEILVKFLVKSSLPNFVKNSVKNIKWNNLLVFNYFTNFPKNSLLKLFSILVTFEDKCYYIITCCCYCYFISAEKIIKNFLSLLCTFSNSLVIIFCILFKFLHFYFKNLMRIF